VRSLAPAIRPHLFVSELRTIAADDLWLSPSHDVDCLAIHFTWRMHVPEVTALLPALDDALAPYAARPHWGKVFQSDRDRLDAAYPRIADFRSLAARLDPAGTFRNDQTSEWLG
jgi:xylitol oxidase